MKRYIFVALTALSLSGGASDAFAILLFSGDNSKNSPVENVGCGIDCTEDEAYKFSKSPIQLSQNSGLNCGFYSTMGSHGLYSRIECDVLENHVSITQVVANRGNCQVLQGFYERKVFKFGDRVIIPTVCNNVLEYSITTNGQTWTWKTR